MLRICSLLVLLLAGPVTAAPAELTGAARVIDGDTLWVGKAKVRLHGIDAVEADQTCTTEHGVAWACGAWVSQRVAALLDGRQVTCLPRDTDRYGRTVATCRLDGQDIAARLVAAGLAQAYARYSDAYLPLEARARAAGEGLWSGRAAVPETYRQAAQSGDKPPDRRCAIKGNISDKGRIYHLPGSKWYGKTTIDPAKGERWFCTAAEAEAAGWRAPRG